MTPLAALTVVGNDVVDLREPRAVGKAGHARFVQRVFTPSEREAIAGDGDPDRALWRRWAAKEAAYKAVSKARGHAPVFEHAAFRVELGAARREGRVEYGKWSVPFTLYEAEDHLHAVAVLGYMEGVELSAGLEQPGPAEQGLSLGELRERFFEPRERPFVHGVRSALARIAARRHIAERLALEERDVLVVAGEGRPGRTPPVVLVRGEPGRLDLSLSHDGRFVAWAFAAHQDVREYAKVEGARRGATGRVEGYRIGR